MSLKPRFAVWLLVVLLLIFAFLFYWNKVEPEAELTAYSVAKRRMLDWANHYRQVWIVRKYPESSVIEDQQVNFNQYGWVLPGSESQPDCGQWFRLLHPEQDVLGYRYFAIEDASLENGYQCRYIFTERRKIVVTLEGEQFSVEIKS
ncbi:hypothetical protein P7F88_01275 [Vibrio hannami]|uniref:hypothetical protein n=1 Tax=Vibrio hannami TaxID=2717094 RepID=UPI0024104E71|nr:hypothetical protein [Vibrio hannami]MDG3084794.1 hypothetical protein [Vibrio hannami]